MEELKQTIRNYMEAANYQFRNGFWFKGRGTATQSDDKIIAGLTSDVKDNNTRNSIIAVIRSIEGDLEVEGDAEDVNEDEIYINEFLSAYENLLMMKWSPVDEEVYHGLRYTMDNDTPIIVAPTGNCKEYMIVGRTTNELYASLAGIAVEGGSISRLKYIANCIVDPILKVCFPGGKQHPSVLNPEVLSSSALDALYGKNPVRDENMNLIGYSMKYIQGKPSVLRYVQCSMESFLANPDNYIANITPVSNDENTYTYRYIPKDMKKGDISAYVKWFNDTFEHPDEVFKVFSTFYGAVLDPNNKGKQGLYIQGFGNDAKTTVNTILGNYLKNAFRPIDPNLMDDPHGWEQFVGTRLGLLDDTKNYSLHRSGWFHKATTPNNKILVNPKHKATYTINAITKMIQLENSPPEMNLNEENQTSRVIYLRCKRKTDEDKIRMGIAKRHTDGTVSNIFDPKFVEKLTEQAEAFLAVCVDNYNDPNGLCPTKAQIIVPKCIRDWMVEDCSDVKDDIIEQALTSLIVSDAEGFISRTEIYDRMKEVMKKEWHGLSSPRTISLMMAKVYNASFVQKRIGDVRTRGWSGVKLKPYLEPRADKPSATEMAAEAKKAQVRDDLANPFLEPIDWEA